MQTIANRGVVSLLIFLLLVAAAAGFGAQFTPGAWYQALNKPSWNPPNSVFGPVWSVIYVCIAIAGWRIWRKGRAMLPLAIWAVQLLLNALWSLLFFGLHRPDIALVDIVALLVFILTFIVVARSRSTLASWLFVPYALWVSFATALNYSILRMN
jgi:tryptophan-rich sensory protein